MHSKRALLLFLLLLCNILVSAQRKSKSSFIKIADVAYAAYPSSDPSLTMLDIYMPVKGSNSPLIIWIHGGSWSYGDKEDIDIKAEYFTSKGFAFVSVNYRLSPKIKHPVHAQDVANAILWVYSNAKHYSADPRKIFLMGTTAGAHLGALVVMDENYLKKAGNTGIIKGLILMDGMGYDIPFVMQDANNKLKSWYAQAFGNNQWDWSQASPANFVSANKNIPPALILYSGTDESAASDANRFYKKVLDTGASVKIIHYPKKSPSSLNKDFGKEDDQSTTDVMRFLQEALTGVNMTF